MCFEVVQCCQEMVYLTLIRIIDKHDLAKVSSRFYNECQIVLVSYRVVNRAIKGRNLLREL